MSRRALLQGAALANFGCGLALLLWLSCARAPSEPGPVPGPPPPDEAAAGVPTPAAAAAAPAAPPPSAASAPPELTSLEAVVSCLEDGGGVRDRRCLRPAAVRGLGGEPALNDAYFSASKAMVMAVPRTPARLVDELAARCAAPLAQGLGVLETLQAQQSANRAAPASPDPAVLPCVLAALAERTETP